MSFELFVQYFAQMLIPTLLFWGVAYYVLIQRKGLKAPVLPTIASFCAAPTILAMIGWPIIRTKLGAPVDPLLHVGLAIASCAMLGMYAKVRTQKAT